MAMCAWELSPLPPFPFCSCMTLQQKQEIAHIKQYIGTMVLSLLLHSSISLIFIYCCCSQLQYHLSDAFTVGGSSLRPQFATLSTTINPQRAPSKLRMLAPKSSTTSESSSSTMQKINSISSPTLIDNYDTFLLDMWGVMHNGSAPYEGVLQTISELKKAGKKLIILSNSSKRRENSEKMLGR